MNAHERRLRSVCEERCGGDPPCYVLDERASKPFAPCVDCRRECGEDVDGDPQPLDPNAVVAPLL